MKVIEVRPGEHPEVKEISGSLESMQEAVQGYIECVYPWETEVCIVCNEEGKINGMEPNRALFDENDGRLVDIIAGPFLIVGIEGPEFRSLTQDEIEAFGQLFWLPEFWGKEEEK